MKSFSFSSSLRLRSAFALLVVAAPSVRPASGWISPSPLLPSTTTPNRRRPPFRSSSARRLSVDPSSRCPLLPGESSSTSTTSLSMSTGKGKNAQRRKIDDFVDFMERPVDTLVDPDSVIGPPHLDECAPLVRAIVRAADSRKAEDMVALRVSKVTALTAFVVLVSGNSRPQNQAISAAIQDAVEEEYDGMKVRGNGVPEGTADSGWILLDYGDVMVHVMTPRSRLFYDVEGQWREKGGERMDLDDVLSPNAPPASRGAAPTKDEAGSAAVEEEEDEDDPFWS